MGRPAGSRNQQQPFTSDEEQQIVRLWSEEYRSITQIVDILERGSTSQIHRLLRYHGAKRAKDIKRCPCCDQIKSRSCFSSRGQGACKLCVREKRLAKDYGLAWGDYHVLLDNQNGRCAICRKLPPEDDTLHLDHCHLTNAVRGLLCLSCNIGIGHLHDDPSVVASAHRYLLKHKTYRTGVRL